MVDLTIAIPVFERKKYFDESINSALNQKVRCEILVVDNNSSHDYFARRCEELGVRYVRNERNIGMFPNWNRCFELAQTKYVMILGDDDILSPDFVSIFEQTLQQYPLIDIYFSNFEIINNTTNQLLQNQHTLPYGFMLTGDKVINFGVKYGLGFPIIASIIKKEKFTGFYEDFHASNDWAWLYENAMRLSFYGERRALLKYRYHDSNDSRKPETIINCQTSILYIYHYLKKICENDNSAIKILNYNIIKTKFFIYTHIRRDHYKALIIANNRYSDLLRSEKKIISNLFISIPLVIRQNIYKLNRRLGYLK